MGVWIEKGIMLGRRNQKNIFGGYIENGMLLVIKAGFQDRPILVVDGMGNWKLY